MEAKNLILENKSFSYQNKFNKKEESTGVNISRPNKWW